MRKPTAASATANSKTSLPGVGRTQAPFELVCGALALAILALACRIASLW